MDNSVYRLTFPFAQEVHEVRVQLAHGAYLLSDDPDKLELRAIHEQLVRAKRCAIDSPEKFVAAANNSLCLGVYGPSNRQVGFLRAITDFVSFCHLCDLYVDQDHRFLGLAKLMLAVSIAHPRLRAIPHWHLVTHEAQNLFAQAGFVLAARSGVHMERTAPSVHSPCPSPDEERLKLRRAFH